MSHPSRHTTASGHRWARLLPESLSLDLLPALPAATQIHVLAELRPGSEIDPGDPLLDPLEPFHGVWACGVTSHLESTNTVETR